MRARELKEKFVGQTVKRRGARLACRVSFRFPPIDNRDWMHLFLHEQCLGSYTRYGHNGTATIAIVSNFLYYLPK